MLVQTKQAICCDTLNPLLFFRFEMSLQQREQKEQEHNRTEQERERDGQEREKMFNVMISQ